MEQYVIKGGNPLVGEVEIGGSSYSGIGHSKEITNPNVKGDMELNCGVGNITVTFTK